MNFSKIAAKPLKLPNSAEIAEFINVEIPIVLGTISVYLQMTGVKKSKKYLDTKDTKLHFLEKRCTQYLIYRNDLFIVIIVMFAFCIFVSIIY